MTMPNNTGPMTQDNMMERVACPDCKHAWAAPPTLPREAAAEIERLREALADIANAQRLGTETDPMSWYNLAQACQETARAALTEGKK